MATHSSILAWRIPWTEESRKKSEKIYHAWSKAEYLSIYTDKQMILWESLIRKKIITSPLETELFPLKSEKRRKLVISLKKTHASHYSLQYHLH